MKLAFIFDTCLIEYQNHYYSVNLTQQLWKTRYLSVFDDIVVITRVKHSDVEPKGKLVQSDMEGVSFRTIDNSSSLKRVIKQKKEEVFIRDAITDCDFAIVRSWWGVNACKKQNIPYLFEVITDAWDVMWNHSLVGKAVAIPYFFKQRSAIKNAPYVMYVTEKTLQKRYPTSGVNIGISDVYLTDKFTEDVLVRRIEKINNNSPKIVLGTAAAVDVRFKGQRFIIRAIAKLKEKGIDNIEYQIVGSGNPEELKYEARKCGVMDRIIFVGAIPHDVMYKWYDSIDIYVQPSLQEGLPRAVVEAMSRALPCMGTSTGGIPELIPEQFICRNKGNISQGFVKMLSDIDSNRMVDMAIRNYEFSKKYDVDLINQKRRKFLQNAVKSIK